MRVRSIQMQGLLICLVVHRIIILYSSQNLVCHHPIRFGEVMVFIVSSIKMNLSFRLSLLRVAIMGCPEMVVMTLALVLQSMVHSSTAQDMMMNPIFFMARSMGLIFSD